MKHIILSTIWLTRGLLVLIIFSVLTGCTYQKTYSRGKLQKLPVPVPEKPETATVVPESPSAVVSPSPIPVPNFYVHKVRWKGETLFIIAKWYTGSWENWKALANANPKLNPKLMRINETIFIPEDLMKAHKPMPLSFLSSFIRKNSIQSHPSDKPSKENHVTEMFGPIEADLPLIESRNVELFGPKENDLDFIDSDATDLFKPIE